MASSGFCLDPTTTSRRTTARFCLTADHRGGDPATRETQTDLLACRTLDD